MTIGDIAHIFVFAGLHEQYSNPVLGLQAYALYVHDINVGISECQQAFILELEAYNKTK